MASAPTLDSSIFTWKDGQGVAELSDLNFGVPFYPTGFYVRSKKTDVVKFFVYDMSDMAKNEFYDGALYTYISDDGKFRITLIND